MIVQLGFAVAGDGLVYDELAFIACGYNHLVEGDFRLTAGHRPSPSCSSPLPSCPFA